MDACPAVDSSVMTRSLLSKCGVSKRLLSKWPIVELKELVKLAIPTVSLLVCMLFITCSDVMFITIISIWGVLLQCTVGTRVVNLKVAS